MKSKPLIVFLFLLLLFVFMADGICIVNAETTGEPIVSYGTWGKPPGWHSQENLVLTLLPPLPNENLSGTVVVRMNISTQAWPINSVYYEADWQERMHCIYNISNQTFNPSMLYKLAITANFTDIPNGKHHLTVYAHIHDGSQNSASIDFTVNNPSQNSDSVTGK